MINQFSENLSCSWNTFEDYIITGCTLFYRLADGFDYYPGYGTELGRVNLSSMITRYTIEGLRPYAGYIVELQCNVSMNFGSGNYTIDDNGINGYTHLSNSLVNITQPSS